MSLQGWTLSNNIIFFLLLLVSTTFVYCDFQPREFHLAFTNNPNELVVSFHTSNYSEQLLGKPLITFSTSENLANYETASVGSVVTSYGDSSKTGFDFHVLLTNLKFATKYYYKCGFEKAEFLSETFFFYTRTDPKSDESKETTIVIYGDQGTTNSKYVIAQTQGFVSNFLQKSKNKNLFIYHLGDIGYADDFAGAMYQPIWTKYMQMMNRIMPYVPYMVCVGNHENGPQNKPYDEFEAGFQAYNHRFFMPSRNDSSIGHNMWYTFKQGLITFIATDTETNFPQSFFPQYDNLFSGNKNQLIWLEETLKNVDRKETPFLIIVGHRPIYSSDYAFSDIPGNIIGESLRLQAAFEDLLYKYHVDIAFYGHVHSYERTHPVYKTKVESKTNMHNLRYPIHIVNGAGGNIEGLTATKDYHFGHEWTASIYNKDEGFGVLKTSSDSKVNSLTFNYFAATTGQQVDTFTITKDI